MRKKEGETERKKDGEAERETETEKERQKERQRDRKRRILSKSAGGVGPTEASPGGLGVVGMVVVVVV